MYPMYRVRPEYQHLYGVRWLVEVKRSFFGRWEQFGDRQPSSRRAMTLLRDGVADGDV